MLDDFIHRFLECVAGKKNLALYYGKRGRKRRMTVADVVMRTLSAYSTGQATLKHLRTSKNFSSLKIPKRFALRQHSDYSRARKFFASLRKCQSYLLYPIIIVFRIL